MGDQQQSSNGRKVEIKAGSDRWPTTSMTDTPVIQKQALNPNPRLPMSRLNVVQLSRVIGNQATIQLTRGHIQREAAAAPVPEQKSAPSTLDQGLKTALIAGDFAYTGYYEPDATGRWTRFENAQLNTAVAYFSDVWMKKVTENLPSWATPKTSKKQATAYDPSAQQERNEAAKVQALDATETRRKNGEARINTQFEASQAQIMNNKKISDDQRTQRLDALNAWRENELKKLIAQTQVNPDESIRDRWEAHQRDKAEGNGKGTQHVDEYKADRPNREARKAVYEDLLKQIDGLDTRREAVVKKKDDLAKAEESLEVSQDEVKIYTKDFNEYYNYDPKKHGPSKEDFEKEKLERRKALLRVRDVMNQLKSKVDGLKVSIPEEERQIADDEFRLRAQLIHLAPTLKQTDAKSVKEAQAFVQQKLAEEDAANAQIASQQGGEGGSEAPQPQTTARWHDIQKEVTSTSADKQFEDARVEVEDKKQTVVAGDTEGMNIKEHPEWFKAILPRLIGLAPQGSTKMSAVGLPAWDEEASAAQALLHSYLNAWTRRRLAENQTKDLKKKATPGQTITPVNPKTVKIPSNLEAMNAVVGFSETNKRSAIYENNSDWCGPATDRSIALGLWKRGLLLTGGKSTLLSIQHLAEIKQLVTAIDEEQKKPSPNAAMIQQNWMTIGKWVKQDIIDQGTAYLTKFPITPKGQQGRMVSGRGVGTAKINPGDMVIWMSGYPYGPLSGHVATVIEEKDRNDNATSTNEKVSTLRVTSGNSGGVVDGEGALRPESVKRLVTSPWVEQNYYGVIAAAGNPYYYSGNMRGTYNDMYKKYHDAVDPAAKSADARSKVPDLDKKIEALQAELSALPAPSPADTVKTKIARTKKQLDLSTMIKNRDKLKAGILVGGEQGETALVKKHEAEKTALEAKKKEIADYKSQFSFPVHKQPRTPADEIEPGPTRWNQKREEVSPAQKDEVWIVSIVRASMLDSNAILSDEIKSGEAVDDKTLAEKGVMRMPSDLLPYLKRYFAEGLGFPTLLLTEEEASAQAAARKKQN